MRGCVHIYCGDGKGKTSSAVGLAVRASGRGKKVLIVRFLKTEDSGEVEVLRKIPGITVTPCDRTFGFVFRMNEEQKREAGAYFQSRFENAVKTAVEDGVDLLVLDEILASCNYGMVREDDVAEFLRNRPAEMEVVLTGRDPSDRLIALADYVSEIKMVKHPYTQGIGAREGIEY
ncbi:cob(I)yrinic acid a,c-diamide adenosyltransferase [Brotaphodocola catenula]|uniref:Cob(I)yrinic acid a,c-diamide adenosyltransferase n=1 Tax=Brotaphodocola catenula TaxID=2885361 RepID=A0AAE3DKP9_9FIRM|nr:cob(I)yrinic acid a,c-diamide adenosyltransferase [Brotaphodocola catenula]MCC2164283.1 cob(I)yrinic acid a,c-diamide adenosyltransferase [Brotaphodocola catenula]